MALEVGKYLDMLRIPQPGAKTGKWEVRNRMHGNRLGHIAWFGRWRQYAGFSWTCHACGEARPDDKISVLSTVRLIEGIPVTHNVRYCNDKTACQIGASKVDFLPPPMAS